MSRGSLPDNDFVEYHAGGEHSAGYRMVFESVGEFVLFPSPEEKPSIIVYVSIHYRKRWYKKKGKIVFYEKEGYQDKYIGEYRILYDIDGKKIKEECE